MTPEEEEAALEAEFENANSPETEDETNEQDNSESEESPQEEVAEGGDMEEDSAEEADGGEPEVAGDGDEEAGIEGEVEVLPPESAPTGMLMSPGDMDRMAKIEDWAEGFSKRMGHGITTNGDAMIVIAPDTDIETVKSALAYVSDTELSSSNMELLMQVAIAELIAFIAAEEKKSHAVVMSEQNICETFGRKPDTVYKWLRVVEEIPKECFKYGLTMSHYVCAALVKKPTATANLKDFQELRKEILQKASIDPKAYPSRQIKRDLEAYVESVEPATKTRTVGAGAGKLKGQLVDLYRLRDAAAVNSEVLDEAGTTMADIVDGIETLINDLVDRGELVADVTKITVKLPSDPDESDEEEEESDPIDVESEEVE